jgi:three-Cys-motif partner protein
MSESNCPGCSDHESNTTDGCCNLRDADDGLPARCAAEWSRDKHFYLSRYFDIFTTGMKYKWKNLVFVDMCAGPGRCRVRPRGDFVDGSPVMAHGHAFTHAYYVDTSPRCVAALHKRLAGLAGPHAQILEGDANALVQMVHDHVRALGHQTIGFAFIDPPGIEIAFDSLRCLTDRPRS